MRREEAIWFYFVTKGGTEAAQWSWFWFCKVEPKVGTPEFLSANSPFEPGELGPNWNQHLENRFPGKSSFSSPPANMINGATWSTQTGSSRTVVEMRDKDLFSSC